MAHPRMYDPDDPLLARIREMALSFPGSDEKESHGRPAFYTRKVFAYYGGSVKADGVWHEHDRSILFLPDPAERPAFEADQRFWVPAYLGPSGWLGLDLEPDSDFEEVAELLEESVSDHGPETSGCPARRAGSLGDRQDPWHDPVVTSRTQEQRLSDLAWLRRARDRIDREYARPLDVEAIASGVHMSAGHFSRQFKLAYGESPYSYLMTRRVERAMALLRGGGLSVTEVCFAVGFSSLGTFSTRFTELVGVPPSVYREQAAGDMAGVAPCVAKVVTRPIRNREAPVATNT